MEENKFYTADQEKNDDYIDLTRLFQKCVGIIKRFKVIGLILVLVGVLFGLLHAKNSYTLRYDAYMTCSISDNLSAQQTTSNISIADQMSKTFTYIVNSGVLMNVVAKELGIPEVLSAISASPLENTSMITIHVIDEDPVMAWMVLNSVMENYHPVAEYSIGSTKLTPIDSSGVPTEPMSEVQYIKYAGICGFVGLIIFLAFVLVLANFYKCIETPQDITNNIDVSLLTVIPHVEEKKRSGEEETVLAINKKTISSSFIEGFRLLGNHLEKNVNEYLDRGPVVMVTSTDFGEGKSTVAMNLSLLLAQRGHKVLLVDCDMHKPTLAKRMSIGRMEKNIYTVLTGDCKLEEAIGRNKKYSLHFLGAGCLKEGAESVTLLSSERMRRLMDEAAQIYDFVIVDTPPMSLFSDAAAIAPLCDSAIYVVRNDYAPAADVLEQMEYLVETGVKMEGFVFNDAKSSIGGAYGYGYGYGSGYGYRYRYGSYARRYGKKYSYGNQYMYDDQYSYGFYENPYAANRNNIN